MGKATEGEELLGALLTHKDLNLLVELGEFADMLSAHEKEAWSYISQFISKHKSFPTHETVEVESKVILPSPPEMPSYYFDHLRKRWVHEKLKVASVEAKQHLKLGKADPDKAYEVMMSRLLEVHERNNAGKLFDARFLVDPVLFEHTQALPGMKEGIQFGWPYLDNISGGLRAGDLVSYVGRPAHGKTWQLLWSARHVWRTQHRKAMFVSMEMEAIQILTRLAALESHVENKIIKGGQMSGWQQDKVEGLKYLEKDDTPFWVVDGALTATVNDILLMARTLNPDVLYIDGAYLVRHPDPKLGPYQRVAIVCEQIKMDLANGLRLPVVASWQFSRQANKKKSDEKIGLEDIAYSDVIGQLSSIVLGLFEGETIESQKRKRIDLLKGRGGEEGEFYIHWRFSPSKNKKGIVIPGMDFSQWSAGDPVNKEVATKDETSYGG